MGRKCGRRPAGKSPCGGEVFVPGKAYTEEISCANTGTIDEYVRITIYKYWTDPEGNKVLTKDKESGLTTQELTPELIRFTFPNEDCWILDSENSARQKSARFIITINC